MPSPSAVMIAPDRTTKYLATFVEQDLDAMSAGDVLEVHLATPAARVELADWAICNGRPIRNGFDRPTSTRLLIVSTSE